LSVALSMAPVAAAAIGRRLLQPRRVYTSAAGFWARGGSEKLDYPILYGRGRNTMRLATPGIGVTQIAHRLGVSPATLYRYIPAARTANTPGI
jgi:hypothetical protein